MPPRPIIVISHWEGPLTTKTLPVEKKDHSSLSHPNIVLIVFSSPTHFGNLDTVNGGDNTMNFTNEKQYFFSLNGSYEDHCIISYTMYKSKLIFTLLELKLHFTLDVKDSSIKSPNTKVVICMYYVHLGIYFLLVDQLFPLYGLFSFWFIAIGPCGVGHDSYFVAVRASLIFQLGNWVLLYTPFHWRSLAPIWPQDWASWGWWEARVNQHTSADRGMMDGMVCGQKTHFLWSILVP